MDAFWLPPDCGVSPTIREETIERGDQQVWVRWPELTPEDITRLGAYLRGQQERVLKHRSLASILDSLDTVAAQWLNTETTAYQTAVSAIATVTGFFVVVFLLLSYFF